MIWFAKKEWAVVVMSSGSAPFGVDRRRHDAVAVRHWPQTNAATIFTGMTKAQADAEVIRLNALNDQNRRAMRIADLDSDGEQ